MKKSNLILAILCLALGFALAACSDDDEEKKDTGVTKKEAGVDMPVKTPDKGTDKKVTKPDKGTDGVTTPDMGTDGVTTPDMSMDSALPDMPFVADMPKTTCSFPFKYITLKGGKGSASGEVKSTEKSNITLAATSCTKTKTQGAEHLYAVYLTSGVKYHIQVTPASGYDAAFYVFTKCSAVAATCIAGADSQYSGSAESATFTPPVTGVYFIGVDSQYVAGSSLSYGKYTVSVQEAKTPKNDTCAGATTLTFPTGKMSITETGTTIFATNKSNLTSTGCTKYTSAGADVFYKMNLTKDTLYKFKVDSPTSGNNESLYIFTDCSKIGSSCVAGKDSSTVSAEEISFTPKTSGVYYIAVDGRSSTSKGSYTLTVDKFLKPTNDACNKATTLALVAGKAKVSGHTIGATNSIDLTSSGCTKKDTEGPDVYYAVTLKAGQAYSFLATPATGYDVSVYLLSSCAASACVAGSDSNLSGSADSFIFTPKTAGTYYIGVDTSYASTSTYSQGKFTLEVAEFTPAKNDSCKTAQTIALVGGKATITAKKGLNASDQLKKCGTFTLNSTDLFYKFTPGKGKTYKITFKPKGSGGRFAAWDGNHKCVASAIETACGKLGSQFVTGGSTGTLSITSSGGDIYLIADGLGTYYDIYDFTFEIAEIAVPKNNSCVTPTTMTLVGGKASVSGDTTNATNSVALTSSDCAGTSSAGKDLFYAVTLTGGKAYKVSLTPSSSFDGLLYAFTNCGTPAKSCAAGISTYGLGKVETIKLSPSTTSTYFIGVDASSSSYSGKFTLKVEETAPPPANSKCTGAKTLSIPAGGGTITGDTFSSLNEYGSNVTCTSSGYSGPQLYYQVLMLKGKTYKFDLTPTGFTSYMYLFPKSLCGSPTKIGTACKSGSTTGSYASVYSGSTGSIIFTAAYNQFMVLAIDSISGSGKFTLKSAIVAKPKNDTCAGATALKLVGGKVSTKGDTLLATSTVKLTSSGCTKMIFQGPDVFYSVDLKAGTKYKLKATPSSGYNLGVFVFTDCTKAAATCVAGADTAFSGSAESLLFTPVKTGKHYIAVGSQYINTSSLSKGSFTLDVMEFKTPTNDTCKTATPLTFTAGVATAKGDNSTATNTISLSSSGCTSWETPGFDQFYSVKLTAGKTYTIDLTWADTSVDLATYIFTDCTKAGATCLAGSDKVGAGKFENMKVTPKTTGTYYIAVDAWSSSETGSYTLTVK